MITLLNKGTAVNQIFTILSFVSQTHSQMLLFLLGFDNISKLALNNIVCIYQYQASTFKMPSVLHLWIWHLVNQTLKNLKLYYCLKGYDTLNPLTPALRLTQTAERCKLVSISSRWSLRALPLHHHNRCKGLRTGYSRWLLNTVNALALNFVSHNFGAQAVSGLAPPKNLRWGGHGPPAPPASTPLFTTSYVSGHCPFFRKKKRRGSAPKRRM